MGILYQASSYLLYWLRKVGKHSLQSPFVFLLYENVILPSTKPVSDDPLEKFRAALLKDKSTLETFTLGAPSHTGKKSVRTISRLIRYGSTSAKAGRLLENLILHHKCQSIYELGTSLGMTTLYLSRPRYTQVITFEGNPLLVAQAKENFRKFDRENIRIIEGNIDDTLPETLMSMKAPDLVFIDANHRYGPTLKYFNLLTKKNPTDLICVIDDIHWSREMNQAWKEIIQKEEVTLSIDLYDMGIIFVKKGLTPGHFILDW